MPVEQLSTLDRVRREIERNTRRARNGIALVRGTAGPRTGATPRDTIWTSGRSQLWHYRSDAVRISPPLLLVPSLVSRSYVLDLTPGNSFVEQLLGAGFDVYLLDWGEPDERDATNLLEDYVDGYLPAAIDKVLDRGDAAEVNLYGYCFGGVLSLLHAAHNLDSPLRTLSVMATPVDFRQLGPLGDLVGTIGTDLATVLDANGNIPASVILQGFRSVAPVAEVTARVDLWDRMWNDEYVAAYATMTGWATDHIPFPGGVARQTVEQFAHDNALVEGRIVLGGDVVSLAEIDVPFLAILATRDSIVPLAAAEPLLGLVGSSDKEELRLDAGHVGLIVGKTAARTTIPKIIEFLRERSEVVS